MIGDDQLMSNASLVKILVQNRKKWKTVMVPDIFSPIVKSYRHGCSYRFYPTLTAKS